MSPYSQPPAGYGYGQPMPAGGPPNRPRSSGAKIAIVIGAVVAVLVIVAVLLIVRASNQAQAEAEQAAADRVAAAVAPVQGMLDAIAAADAETALSYVDVGLSTDLMTDEVLAVSAELAPITDIQVTAPDAVDETTYSVDIPVSLMLGGEPYEYTYTVYDYNDGEFVVGQATSPLYLPESPGIDMLINGVLVTSEDFELFPGAYEVTTSTEYFELAGTTSFQFLDPYTVDIFDIEPVLTDEGQSLFNETVNAEVEECLGQTTLEAGCGLSIPAELDDGTKFEDGTLERTITTDVRTTLESIEGTPSYDNPTLIEGGYIGPVDVVGDCTKDGQSGQCELLFGPSLEQPSVDLADPELTVHWD